MCKASVASQNWRLWANQHHSYTCKGTKASLMVNLRGGDNHRIIRTSSTCQDCQNFFYMSGLSGREKGFLAVRMVPHEDPGRLSNNKGLPKLGNHYTYMHASTEEHGPREVDSLTSRIVTALSSLHGSF